MSYFKNVKSGDKVYGLVYGKGEVVSVWKDSYYSFEVKYENGQVVPYTEDGNPAWNTGNFTFQTVFYEEDINLMDYDLKPTDKILSPKKIIKLRNEGKLEVRCPSGLWQPLQKCPTSILDGYLENKQFHLFRKTN